MVRDISAVLSSLFERVLTASTLIRSLSSTGDVPEQAGTVVGTDDDVHRISEHRHRPPTDLNDPLGLATAQLQHRSAILTVNADATTLSDITDDRIARQWLAAAGHLRHQVADALNLNIATLAGLVAGGLARDQLQLFIDAIRLNLLLSQIDQLRQTQIARTQCRKHVVGGLVIGLVRQLVEIDLRQRRARQFAFDQGFCRRRRSGRGPAT